MTELSIGQKLDQIIRTQNLILKRLNKLEGKEEVWVSKKKAMEITGYGSTKLVEEVKAGRVPVNQNPRRGRQIMYNVSKFIVE